MPDLDMLDRLGDAMGEVYAACRDRLLVNLAAHFKYVALGRYDAPGASFRYQAEKLAEMGQVTRESVDIITQMLGGGDDALRKTLEAAILDALAEVEPELKRAAEDGLLNGGIAPPEVSPRAVNAFTHYYRQAADRLNLVNTAMVSSTQEAYRATVSDIVNRMQRAQQVLNTATGEVISGVESFNTARRLAVEQLVENGIAGFVDHGGRRWEPEAYVSMLMRTTYHNASRQAFWDRCADYGDDLYLVSQHPGARPLCYPWQCKVISRTDEARWVTDGDGRQVQVIAQSATSYGEAAGLFGVNCGHHPELFIAGATKVPALRQDEETNKKAYAESQKQRGLERALRAARLQLKAARAAEESKDAQKAMRKAVKDAEAALDEFCKATGRKRRREREYTPTKAEWPDPETFDKNDFPTETRDALAEYFRGNRG